MAALKVLLTLLAAAVLWAGMLSYVERERTIEGIWTDAFECSEFFENARFEDLANQQCGDGAWLSYYRPEKSSEHYDLVMRHSKNPETGKFRMWPPAKYLIRFRGERDISLFGLGVVLPVGFGHFSSWGTEYRVQRMISIKPMLDP